MNVEHHNKHIVLENILENLKWENVAAIGDYITDINLLRKVRLRIAFCPKNAELAKIA